MQYTIQKGDTLSQLAVTYGVNVTEIIEANPHIVNRNKIYAGDTIEIPSTAVSSLKGQLQGWWNWYKNLFKF